VTFTSVALQSNIHFV